MKDLRVGFIGNIAGSAYIWPKLLRKKGLKAETYLETRELGAYGPVWEDANLGQEQLPDWIHTYQIDNNLTSGWLQRRFQYMWGGKLHRELLKDLLAYDLINSFSGSLFFYLGSVWELGLKCRRPYIACATGSDLREVALKGGINGRLMRLFFQRAAKTLLLNLDMVDLTERANLVDAEFFPFMIDTEKYSPRTVDRAYGSSEDLLFFMPSHLDWGVVDNAVGRSSTKGNDRFLRAFARYVSEQNRAHAIILDRGTDRGVARKLITELGIRRHVTILPQMHKNELIRHYRMADVVVDQFDVGAFGTTGLEAMSCSKPLLIYINNRCADRCYPQRPPVLNARTEDEIFDQIKLASNESFRNEMGNLAREWIMKHHEANRVSDRLIDIYEEALR